MWKTMVLLIVAYGYQTCFLDFEKELDIRKDCGNTVPSILNPSKKRKSGRYITFKP